MRVVVIGGGFVGQLVQLAVPSARILDARPTAPVDHLDTRVGPQYLWEPIMHPLVASYSFSVTTLVDGMEPTADTILRYKKKIGKEHDGGDWGLQFQHKSRGWHSQLPVPRVEYDSKIVSVNTRPQHIELADGTRIAYDMLVSTIPLPALLHILNPQLVRPSESFNSKPIWMLSALLHRFMSEMEMNYISDPEQPWYRVTTFHDHRYVESLHESTIAQRILPGKILPHPFANKFVRDLRAWDVYCFGRFGTWQPDELAHQSWIDIQQWAKGL
jgi:hypothetical protein